MENSDYIR